MNRGKLFAVLVFLAIVGCQKSQPLVLEPSQEVRELKSELRDGIISEVRRLTGDFTHPKKLPFQAHVKLATLRHGQEVYQLRCVQCHGVSGDGNGPAAAAMYPRPRDYRKGLFKFSTTPYGSKPMRADLVRTVTVGVRGTSMPDFKLLPPEDISDVVDYVIFLSIRGELEGQIKELAVFEEKISSEMVDEEGLVKLVSDRWHDAQSQQALPYSPQPVFSTDHVDRGKKAFLERGCSKCHGEDGRGQTKDNLFGTEGKRLTDAWGHPTRAADLTSGILRGGTRPIDIYQRIFAGINGTPMPAFSGVFKEQPDTLWDLVAYVQFLTDRRRVGDKAPAGLLAPFVPADSTSPASTEPAKTETGK